MTSWLHDLARLLRGERRRAVRPNVEKAHVVNRQWAVATKIAPRLGKRPEDLFDYHRADQILGGRRR